MRHIKDRTWQLLREDRLPPNEMDALLEHLDECPECQARYIETITPRLEELAELVMSDDFTAKTMQRIPATTVTAPQSNVVSISSTVVKSRLSPARLLQQKLVAYVVAASLTIVLMAGGAFSQLASLSRLQVTPPPTEELRDLLLTPKSVALGPLLPQSNIAPAAKAPFNLPPLRLLIERSIANDSQK